jgi:hypothetical protein
MLRTDHFAKLRNRPGRAIGALYRTVDLVDVAERNPAAFDVSARICVGRRRGQLFLQRLLDRFDVFDEELDSGIDLMLAALVDPRPPLGEGEAPDWHLAGSMGGNHVASVDKLPNPIVRKRSSVALRNLGQIRRFFGQSRSHRAIAFSVLTMALGAMASVFEFARSHISRRYDFRPLSFLSPSLARHAEYHTEKQ